MKEELTQDRLKSILDYNPKTGVFLWKKTGNNQFVKKGRTAGWDMGDGYRRVTVLGGTYYAHRLAWLYMHGYFPEHGIDHINRDKKDNRIKNLRVVSQQCNVRNTGVRCNNRSGITGVLWAKQQKKWQAKIAVSGKTIHLGYHKDKIEAAKARHLGEIKYGFKNCYTSSPAFKYLQAQGYAGG